MARKHTHPHEQTPTVPVQRRAMLSGADRRIMFTVRPPLHETAGGRGLADSIRCACGCTPVW